MPWVRFTENFDERISARCVLHRREGSERCVRRSVVREAVSMGAAVTIPRPPHLRSTYGGRVREIGNVR